MLTESGHYYDIDGNPRHTMPNKSKPGQTRATTLADAKKHKLFPSVSAYLKMLAAPGLDNWKMEQLIEACYNEAIGCSNQRFTDYIDEYAARVKEAAFTQVGDAADLGTKIHAALERYYTAEELPEDDEQLRAMVLRTTDRVRGLGVKVIHAEKVLVAPRYGYAGTTDIIFERDGAGVLDFKSKRTQPGKKIFSADSHPMQIAAYWQAWFDDGDFPPDAQGINVYISTTEPGRIEVVEYDDIALSKAWGAFKACLELYRYSTGYDARVL